MFKKLSLLVITIITSLTINAQTGKIAGKIIDAKTGETLPGATVLIEGTTKGASADFDGNFILSNVPAGKVNLIASYISYDNKKIEGVEVKANDVTNVNFDLATASSQELKEVVVQAEMNKENVNTLMVMQKNNASVSDGVSAESIKKTPDKTTSDVIKRISGATIQDNKFAIIRGMSDRYNAAFINGAPLPSSESDKKAFSFDIFPANLLDNIIILKTATPDMPGDFAGGIIQINTKSIPEKNSQSISVGGGYNFQTTNKNFKTYKGGKNDWIGLDDGTRAMPSGLPSTRDFSYNKLDQIEYAKLVNYDWTTQNKKALPNFNIQYSLANVGKIFKRDFGSVFAVTYNNSTSTNFVTRRDFEEESAELGTKKLLDVIDSSFSNNILASALWNLAYKINSNHQISVKNMYSINSEDKVVARSGFLDVNANTKERTTVSWLTQNKIYSGQVIGDHFFEKAKLKVKWVGGYSDVERAIPGLKYMRYILTNGDSIYRANIPLGNTTSPKYGGTMFFMTTKENIKSANVDVSRLFKTKHTQHDIKIGGNYVMRDRSFDTRLLGYGLYRKNSSLNYNYNVLTLDEASIFAPENIGVMNVPGKNKGGLLLAEGTTPKDSYKASSKLGAGYLMVDSRVFEKFRFIYGARIESFNQKMEYFLKPDTASYIDTTVIDILPSVNFVYSITDKINLRFAYYKTVTRPEFRELAPFTFNDFSTGFVVGGNTKLVRGTIDNYDLRGEWFFKPGQMVSASVFYKRIINATEMVADASGQIRNISYDNVPLVTNKGIELEYRVKLSTFLSPASKKIFDDISFFSNVAFIKSKVDVSKLNGTDAAERPLQGQSPFIVNAGVQYLSTDNGWSANASYNVIGRRIVIVGASAEPSYFEAPRHVIDLQASKTFKQKFEIKVNLRYVLAQNQVWYQDLNKNGKLDKNSEEQSKEIGHAYSTDNVMQNTKLSPTVSLSFSYKF